MKKFFLLLAASAMLIGCTNKPASTSTTTTENTNSGGKSKVMLYSSLKEKQLEALKEGFEAAHPEYSLDYYAAGTSKVATKIATEKQSGQIATDLVWIGDPSNYVTFKEQGILEAYESPEAAKIDGKFKDPEHFYTGARLVVMGLTTNTNTVPENEVPKTWKDLLKDEFKGQIVMTDPGESGTTFYLVASLMNNPEYGVELESGTTSTHTKVAAGAYKVAIGVDYVTQSLADQGSTIRFTYPEKDLIAVSSPIALLKDSPNPEGGKALYDYILSKEGQEILAKNDTMPIRGDVKKEGTLSLDEIIARAMVADDKAIAEQSAEILEKFDKIFK